MDIKEIYIAYKYNGDLKYEVETAKSKVLITRGELISKLNVEQLVCFDEYEKNLNKAEEIINLDMIEFVINYLQQKNTSGD